MRTGCVKSPNPNENNDNWISWITIFISTETKLIYVWNIVWKYRNVNFEFNKSNGKTMSKAETFDYAHCWILRCNIMIHITNQYKLLRNDTIFQRQCNLLNVLSKQLSLKVRLYIPKIYLRYLHETKQQSKKNNSFGYNGDTKVDQPVFIDSIFRISLFSLAIWVRYTKNINNVFWIIHLIDHKV